MAVISTKEENKLILELSNGDLVNLKDVLRRWNFKDEQSLLRFLLSILMETQDKELWIKSDDELIAIAPVEHSLNPNEQFRS